MGAPLDRPVRVGVVGLGFMGRTHLAAYAAANRAGYANELVGVADRDPSRRAGDLAGGGNLAVAGASFDPTRVRAHATPEALFAAGGVDLVSLCTPTDTHVDLAIAALDAGLHVLVEKPVALATMDVERLAAAARAADTLCMPAMCVRFWPGWSWLTDRVLTGEYGALRGIAFRRLGSRPDWSPDFYADEARSGGALFDLHVHDVDMAIACCGPPLAVSATGDRDHVHALWHYDTGGPRVALEGGWDHDPAFDFEMGFHAVFERATAVYDLRSATPLVVHSGGASEPVELASWTGYDGEIRALLRAIERGSSEPPVSIEDAAVVTRVLEATAEALARGATVEL